MNEAIWGFDLGTTSIGFAVVDHDPDENTGQIKKLGVRIFPEGVTEKELEPRNRRRREKRLMRRQLRRRKLRRVELTKRMAEVGLLPKFESEEWKALMNTDPYQIRSDAFERKLDEHEVGRALYHLIQRRGFKSLRKSLEEVSGEGADETGMVKESIAAMREEMGGKTLGQHLNLKSKKRGNYLGRQMVEDEFERLWEAQRTHHPDLLTDALRMELRTVAFKQRPVFWRLETLGKCHLEPKAPLCLKSSWVGQQFLMLQDLNALRISGTSEGLPKDQRELIYDRLSRQESMTWGGLRKNLKSLWLEAKIPLRSKFNFEDGQKPKLQGNILEAKLNQVFGDKWENHPFKNKIREELPQKLWVIDYKQIGNKKVVIRTDEDTHQARKDFIREAQSEYGVSAADAKTLSELVLPQGWLSHSEKAIRSLLPHLEKGWMYSEACDIAYPKHRDVKGEGLDLLPSDQKHLDHLRNPTVKRALNELRKVTNNLIRTYGKPDRIRVELARELKLPGARRRDYQNRIKKQESERDKARTDLIENGLFNPKGSDIEKWLLWKESEERCLYTSKVISFGDLFEHGRFEVEHIIPYSICLDNGFMNKTLAEKDFNREKGNRIPYEAFSDDQWLLFKQRVRDSKLPPFKKNKLLSTNLEDVLGEDFSERQLRDSAYIAREARDFLMKLFKKSEGKAFPVETSNGMITAQLRRFWGLNTLLSDGDKKTRDDHRHHAVDALAVSLVSRSGVKNLSDRHKFFMEGRRIDFPLPWVSFRDEAEKNIMEIIVSHKLNSKVSGKLHDEMVYGSTKETRQKSGVNYQIFTRRVDLQSLSKSQLKSLAENKLEVLWDDSLRNKKVVLAHLKKHGDFKEYPSFKLPSGIPREIKHLKLLEPKKPELVTTLERNQANVIKNENHHMMLYQTSDEKIVFDVVSRFDAAMRLSKRQPVIQQNSGKGLFLMSLVKGDTLLVPSDPENDQEEQYLLVESIWDSGVIVTKEISEASKDRNKLDFKKASTWIEKGTEKISVDPIGRVFPKND